MKLNKYRMYLVAVLAELRWFSLRVLHSIRVCIYLIVFYSLATIKSNKNHFPCPLPLQ